MAVALATAIKWNMQKNDDRSITLGWQTGKYLFRNRHN